MKRTTFNLAGYALLLALIARALIPAGFMPAGPAKPFSLMVCPGHMRDMPHQGHDHPGPAHQMPCAFSAAFACGMIAHAAVPAPAHIFTYRNVPLPLVAVVGFSPSKSFLSQGPPPPAV